MTLAQHPTTPTPTGLVRTEVVQTTSGPVRGTFERDANVYRGIPYAEAPIGDLRFAPPRPRTPWTEVLDATTFGPASHQNVDQLSMDMPGAEHYYYRPATVVLDEDSLNLNVWTPAAPHDESAPVLVWIHGGGFLTGSGGSDWFDGARLAAREGIVVVTITYRLGLLGNLWLGDLDPDATNLGTRDQIAALAWVRDNIGAFGGDPARVTVAGQSAGGMSVAALLVAPAATGLFRHAIVHSGHLEMMPDADRARAQTATVLDALHIEPGPDALRQLREVSTIRILQAQRLTPIGTVAPVADGTVLPIDPVAALASGASRDVVLLQGNTATENALFRVTGSPGLPADTSLRAAVAAMAAPLDPTAAAIDAAVAEYEADSLTVDEAWDRATGDVGWLIPARRMTDAHTRSGGTTYAFEFGWRSPARDGSVSAAHEVDVPFLFDNLDATGVGDLLGAGVTDDPAAVRLAAAMSGAWAAFVRDGVPAHPDLPTWEPTSPERRRVMWLDAASSLMVDPHPARDALWGDAHLPNPLTF
jgi:para-nitrobenzyl esterase